MSTWEPPQLPFWWTAPSQSAFVGRKSEFARLEDIWSDVSAGARQLVFIGGDPGVGKSRFVSEAAKDLHASGAAVLVGHCLADYPTAYQPYGEPIRHLLAAADELLAEGERESLRGRLAALVSPEGAPSEGPSSGHEAYDLFEALVHVLRAVSRDRPVVLILEDLHWASSSTTQLLTHLTTHLPDAPLLILCTHRAARHDQSDSLVTAMADLYRLPGVHRLDLEAFDAADVADYVSAECRLPAPQARELAGALHAQTGGNPFFLQAVCRDIRESVDPMIMGAKLHVPVTVRDSYESRLAELDDRDRQVIEIAGVLGERFTMPTLVSVSSWSRSSTLHALEESVELGLLEAVPGTTEHRFPHALARQAILDLIPSVRLAREHAMLAERLIPLSGGTPTEIQRLAYHHYRAQGLVDPVSASKYILAAAQLAASAFAYEEAATHYGQLAELADDAPRRQEFELLAARAHNAAGDFESSLRLSELVVNQTEDAEVELQAAIIYQNCTLKTGQSDPRAVAMLATALRKNESGYDHRTYLWGLASLGTAMAFVGATIDSQRLLDRAISQARESDDAHLLAHTITAALWNTPTPDRQSHQLSQAVEAGDLSRKVRDYHLLCIDGLFRATLGYTTGRPGQIVSATNDMQLAVERTGHDYYNYWIQCVRYGRNFLNGEFERAELVANELLHMSAEWKGLNAEGVHGFQMFMLRRETGALTAVRALITGTEPPEENWPPALLGLYTELEMREPCERVLHWMLDSGLDQYRRTSQWGAMLALLTEAALFLDDTETLRLVHPMLQEFSGHNLTSGHFVALFGSADRYLGQLDSALGIGEPMERFKEAEEMDSRMDSAVHLASTLAALAQHCASQDDAACLELGREAARRARAIAEPIGQARVLRVLDRIEAPNLDVESPAGRSAHPLGLTDREFDVLRALADGASNKEIAEQLIISQNTAANHVRSILMKTGAANRTKAAMMAVSEGWLGT
jgi:DNA-binding CsgD family transcriptional regulator